MHLTGDNLLIKKINRNVVLEIIRWHSPISRTEVNRLSGLNKGTVSTIVNDLIEDNLVHETGSGKSSGGRKPVMLTFNNLAGYAIEINVEINQISGILTDLNGSVRKSMNVFPEAISFNHVYQRLEYIIATLLSATPDSEYGVVGIGIGFPGTVNADGRVQIAPTLGWRDIPLEEILQTRFNLPITVSNEAKVGAQGEFAYGAGKNSTDLLYLSISHGIGSSIMINKKFYKGHQGYSGDVGHTTFDI